MYLIVTIEAPYLDQAERMKRVFVVAFVLALGAAEAALLQSRLAAGQKQGVSVLPQP